MAIDYGKYNDADLVKALTDDKNISEAAFSEIYSRYSQRIYAYCLRIMGHQEDAQDVFQEVFVKFYNMANSLNYVENLPGLLITISRNLCLNSKRDLKLNTKIEDFNLVTYDKGYDNKELLQLISRALVLLDFEYREVFILRQYHGMSYTEIAKIIGESESTARNRAWRAKEKIKEILSPYLADLSK